jgi:hypothetical protein
MKKKLKPVEGSADEDTREIEEADQIRLRAISVIQTLLKFVNSSSAICLVLLLKLQLFSPADRIVIDTLTLCLVSDTFYPADRIIIGT